MASLINMKEILCKIGFFALGVLSLIYVIFSRDFAEMHVQLYFLNFPVFVGEISLIIFLILSFFVYDFRSLKGWQWGVVFYFVCVIAKAFWGYSHWGPLAFRHAALFYYLIFIFFGFIFYKRSFLPEPIRIFIAFLALALCITGYFYLYWILTLWIIAFILMKSFRHKAIKYSFYAVLLSIIAFSYKSIILAPRTFITGNLTAVIFLMITLLLIANIRIFYKVIVAGTFLILLIALIFKYSSVNDFGSIFDIKNTINLFRISDAKMKTHKPYYVRQELKDIKLFNPEHPTPVPPADAEKTQTVTPKKEGGLTNNDDKYFWVVEPSGAGNAYGNTLFRLFIWRDMFLEFYQYRPILGFSFGKPFRSESLEIMNWASEWNRDGWIEPHNSYFNIIYRMGILGIALICFLIWQFCSMVKSFISLKSSSGLLLCSILINWSIAANFLPILELPYNAIPFWSLWGVTLGYLKEIENKS